MKITLIYLASGFSRRFGSNKLLYPINGKPMYEHTLASLIRLEEKYHAKFDELQEDCPIHLQIILVTQYAQIAQYALNHGVKVVRNKMAQEGITASIRLGVEAAKDSDWYAFFVADQPYLQEKTIRSFLTAAMESGKTMASVISSGVPGNPTVFHKIWTSSLLSLTGDRGGRILLNQHPEQVFWYEVEKEEVKDIDFQNFS